MVLACGGVPHWCVALCRAEMRLSYGHYVMGLLNQSQQHPDFDFARECVSHYLSDRLVASVCMFIRSVECVLLGGAYVRRCVKHRH